MGKIEKILNFLVENRGKWFSSKEIQDSTKIISTSTVSSTLNLLKVKGKVKHEKGKYTITEIHGKFLILSYSNDIAFATTMEKIKKIKSEEEKFKYSSIYIKVE